MRFFYSNRQPLLTLKARRTNLNAVGRLPQLLLAIYWHCEQSADKE